MKTTHKPHTMNEKLIFTRIIDAPRALVYEAWTDPEHMAAWWGPEDFTNTCCEMDVRPGGSIRIDMEGPDGRVYPMTGVFHEVVAPEKLVFSGMALHDEHGNAGLEVKNTVLFEHYEGKTRLHLNSEVVRSVRGTEDTVSRIETSWSQSLNKLMLLPVVL